MLLNACTLRSTKCGVCWLKPRLLHRYNQEHQIWVRWSARGGEGDVKTSSHIWPAISSRNAKVHYCLCNTKEFVLRQFLNSVYAKCPTQQHCISSRCSHYDVHRFLLQLFVIRAGRWMEWSLLSWLAMICIYSLKRSRRFENEENLFYGSAVHVVDGKLPSGSRCKPTEQTSS